MATYYARFRHLAIQGAKPAPTVEQLAAIEELLGTQLPASFRDFLEVANGGYMEYVIDVPFDDGRSEPLSFCSIFSADEGNFGDDTLIGEIRSGREYQRIPQGVLPFARDGGGSMVYLDLSPEGNGQVVVFVVGLPEWTGLRTKSEYICVASSFDDYVNKLRIDREVVLDNLTHDTTAVEHVDAIEELLEIGLPLWREDSEIVREMTAARGRVSGGS